MTRRARELTSRPEYIGGTLTHDLKDSGSGKDSHIALGYSYTADLDANASQAIGEGKGFIMPLNDWVTFDQVGVHYRLTGNVGDSFIADVAIYRNIDTHNTSHRTAHPGKRIFLQRVESTSINNHVATEAISLTLAPGLYWVVVSKVSGSANCFMYKRQPAYYINSWEGGGVSGDESNNDLITFSSRTNPYAVFRVAETSPGSGLHRFHRRIQFDESQNVRWDDSGSTNYTQASTNLIHYIPFQIARDKVLDEIKIYHLLTNSDIELGIYTHKPGVGPDSLLASVNQTITAAGFVAYSSIGQYLPAGRYWIGVQQDAVAQSMSGIANDNMFSDAVDEYPQYYMTEAGASLPSTASPSAALVTGPKAWVTFEDGIRGTVKSSEIHIPGSVLPIRGQWIGGMCTPTKNTLSNKFMPATNATYYIPHFLEEPSYIRALQFDLSTVGGGSSNCRLAVYRDNGSFYPGERLWTSGDILMDAAGGAVLVPGPRLFNPGIFWFAWWIAVTDLVELFQHWSIHPQGQFLQANGFDAPGLLKSGSGSPPATAPSGMSAANCPRLHVQYGTIATPPGPIGM